MGILAQSIGGGGGNVGHDSVSSTSSSTNVAFTLGRSGGTGGNGDNVTVSASGNIDTHGDRSHGVLAQSIGNGGGNSSSTSFSASNEGASSETDSASDDGEEAPGKSFQLAIGIAGAEGGLAGDVVVGTDGSITTRGVRSHGIFAVSYTHLTLPTIYSV